MITTHRFANVALRGALVLCVTCVLAAGCGVSKSKYLEVTKSEEQLKAETQKLQAQNQELQKNLDQVNKDKAQLETEKAALDEQAKHLQATQDSLSGKIQEQQKSADEVKATYQAMLGHLQGEVSSGKIEIQQQRDGINVNLAQDILFKSGSATLDKSGKEILTKVADQMKGATYQVLVTGHTDNQKISTALAARYPTTWELGAARASTIVRLFESTGIAKERLAAVSFADSRPREPNTTPAGRAKNRRIEIRLRPVAAEAAASN